MKATIRTKEAQQLLGGGTTMKVAIGTQESQQGRLCFRVSTTMKTMF